MLQYMPEYRKKVRLYKILAFAVFLIALITVFGPDVFSNILGLIMVGAIVFVANSAGSWLADFLAKRKAKRILDRYSMECNPEAFIKEGRPIIDEIIKQPPFKGIGAFYLSMYCSALIDQDHIEDATQYMNEIYNAAKASKAPGEVFGLFVNLYAPTRDLFGFDEAEECLTEAEAQMEKDEKLSKTAGAPYVAWNRQINDAVKSGDNQVLISLYKEKLKDAAQPPRERVDLACKLAAVYRELGDSEQETATLRTIVAFGNALSCVSAAQERLEELEAAGAS